MITSYDTWQRRANTLNKEKLTARLRQLPDYVDCDDDVAVMQQFENAGSLYMPSDSDESIYFKFGCTVLDEGT